MFGSDLRQEALRLEGLGNKKPIDSSEKIHFKGEHKKNIRFFFVFWPFFGSLLLGPIWRRKKMNDWIYIPYRTTNRRWRRRRHRRSFLKHAFHQNVSTLTAQLFLGEISAKIIIRFETHNTGETGPHSNKKKPPKLRPFSILWPPIVKEMNYFICQTKPILRKQISVLNLYSFIMVSGLNLYRMLSLLAFNSLDIR